MKVNLLSIFLVSFMLLSCNSENDSESFFVSYKADFDIETIPKVENIVREFAKNHQLRIIEKNRANMKILNKGREGFMILLHSEGNFLISIKNIVVPNRLDISLFDEGGVASVEELTSIVAQLVTLLENRMNISFEIEERRERKELATKK